MSPKEVTLCQKCRSTFRVDDHTVPSSLVTDLRDGIQIRADAHAESIKQTLDGLQPKLCEYDAKIEALEETLAYLKKGRADLAHAISVYKTYLAPIRRLPVELLHKIFSEACAFVEFPINRAREIQSPSQIPFRIASVCSYWRDICLSSHRLWSIVFIDADDPDVSKSTRNLLSLYKQRSFSEPAHVGVSALSLYFRQELSNLDSNDSDHLMAHYTFLKTVFSSTPSLLNLSSCRSLFLEMGSEDIFLPSPNFASLERLDINGWIDEDYESDSLSTLFSKAPLLRELHLHGTTMLIQNFAFDWSRIDTLWLEKFDKGLLDTVELLSRFPQLDVLAFNGGRFGGITSATIIPGVRVLQIWNGSVLASAAGLLHALIFPDLRRLELLDGESGSLCLIATEDINAIVASLASASFLEDLRVEMIIIQDVDLIQILEATLNLTKVAIVEPCRHSEKFSITEKLLERLMDVSGFLPKLEDLELVWAEDNAIQEEKVLDVIASRRGRLQSVLVGIRGGGELDGKTLRRIQGFRELGLTVRLY